MEELFAAYERAQDYPRTLLRQQQYNHVERKYIQDLDDREDTLFEDEDQAAMDVWQSAPEPRPKMKLQRVCSSAELTKVLRVSTLPSHQDPNRRYVFIHAPDSRSRLRVTRNMMTALLTYYQVMPAFLGYLFCFGEQVYEQDFNFSGVCFDSFLGNYVDVCIPALRRSGRRIQMCYVLRSVEPSPRQREWPWSIRSTAVYHSFDIETETAVWMVVKGSESMKDRMMLELDPSRSGKAHNFHSLEHAFEASLATHMLLCSWSGEHWRWYINHMEEAVQKITRRTLTVTVPETSIAHNTSEKQPVFVSELDNFSFSNLQEIQYIEEKANTALLVISLDIKVLRALVETYESIVKSDGLCADKRITMSEAVLKFVLQTANIVQDLEVQQARAETLVRLLNNRKTLLYGILEYRSMESSKLLAKKAQVSASHMEEMTIDMHDIAHKTKQEAVSMRIITLVTLFFLPGTFISTLMSTDIVHWGSNADGQQQRTVSAGAIQTFLAITIPLMVLTFAAWYVVYWWLNWRQKARLSTKPVLPV